MRSDGEYLARKNNWNSADCFQKDGSVFIIGVVCRNRHETHSWKWTNYRKGRSGLSLFKQMPGWGETHARIRHQTKEQAEPWPKNPPTTLLEIGKYPRPVKSIIAEKTNAKRKVDGNTFSVAALDNSNYRTYRPSEITLLRWELFQIPEIIVHKMNANDFLNSHGTVVVSVAGKEDLSWERHWKSSVCSWSAGRKEDGLEGEDWDNACSGWNDLYLSRSIKDISDYYICTLIK